MNSAQKEQIISMRKQKMTYAVISEKIGVSIGTIKSFCHRNGITVDKAQIVLLQPLKGSVGFIFLQILGQIVFSYSWDSEEVLSK